MTKEELASSLNGMHYGSEISEEIIEKAKKSNLRVVYALPNESAPDDTSKLPQACLLDLGDAALNDKVTAIWIPNGYPTWSYRTSIPHSTFDIMMDENVYCKGIVFELASL